MPKFRKQDILTIPNLLTLIRLILIPVFVYQYVVCENYLATAVILLVSGVTDVADGLIARHFHMVSDLGKMLDPVADKLTQLAMLVCLVRRFPLMLMPVILLVIKELAVGISSLAVVRRTQVVKGAVWHGKVTTVLLYMMMVLHLFWYNIPQAASDLSIIICVAMMLVSFGLYIVKNVRELLANAKEKNAEKAAENEEPPASGMQKQD